MRLHEPLRLTLQLFDLLIEVRVAYQSNGIGGRRLSIDHIGRLFWFLSYLYHLYILHYQYQIPLNTITHHLCVQYQLSVWIFLKKKHTFAGWIPETVTSIEGTFHLVPQNIKAFSLVTETCAQATLISANQNSLKHVEWVVFVAVTSVYMLNTRINVHQAGSKPYTWKTLFLAHNDSMYLSFLEEIHKHYLYICDDNSKFINYTRDPSCIKPFWLLFFAFAWGFDLWWALDFLSLQTKHMGSCSVHHGILQLASSAAGVDGHLVKCLGQ